MNLLDLKREYESKYDEMLCRVLSELSLYYNKKYICRLVEEPQFVKHHQLFHWVDSEEMEEFSYYYNDMDYNRLKETNVRYDGTIRLSKDVLVSIYIQFNFQDLTDEYIFNKFSITYINYGKLTYSFTLLDDYDSDNDKSDQEYSLNELYRNEDTHEVADIIDYFIFNANKIIDDIENTFLKMSTTNYLSHLPAARTILLIGKYTRLIPYDIAKIISQKILFFKKLFFVNKK